jgi:hypothetical protein
MGYNTTASGIYSTAMGFYAQATNTGAFVWSDNSSATPFGSKVNNEFAVRASGGVRFQTSYMQVSGAGSEQAYMGGDGAGGDVEIGSRNASIMNVGFWNSAAGSHMNIYCLAVIPTSDRNAKENFTPLDTRSVLEKVVALPLTEWNYKADPVTKHIGPMAQDFYAAFGVGPDDKHIATVDADGVALAAIQGLNQKFEEREASLRGKLEHKETEITELKQQLAELKVLVEKLAHQQ